MIIELRRAHSPEEMGEQDCAFCEVSFEVESIVATPVGVEGKVCPSCVEYLHQRNPEASPSIEEYEEALKRYPEPLFNSVEEILHLERADLGAASDALEAGWISR